MGKDVDIRSISYMRETLGYNCVCYIKCKGALRVNTVSFEICFPTDKKIDISSIQSQRDYLEDWFHVICTGFYLMLQMAA